METVLLHKSAFLYVTSIFRLSSFVFANALLTGITKTFVPFYSSFPEIYRKSDFIRQHTIAQKDFERTCADCRISGEKGFASRLNNSLD